MNNRKESQITLRLREMKKRKWQVMLLFCLSILVAAGVAGVFRLPPITKTYQVRELTCTAVPPKGEACADFFVHAHNDDCFDGDGNLVCPLPEIKPHRHTEDCYTTSRVQVCDLPESDGHQHTADCYTSVRGDMICELSTEPILDEEGNVLEEGHVHTDECYEWHDELICDMEEGQGAHHHNDRCFVTETTLICDKPEIFLHTHTDDCYLKNEDGNLYVDENGNNRLVCDQVQVLQHVHGPECFTIRELDDESDETDPESNASGQFVFLYEENEEETEDGTDGTEPDEAGENHEVLEEAAQTDEENGEPAEETTDEETDKETGEETEQADGKTEESSSEEPLSIRMPAQNFEESTDTVRVRVAAPDGAFPPETIMRVTQVEIESVMDVVQESVGGEITRVQAVDISFFDADGNEIEPMVPIHVDMIPVTDSGNDETEETAATPDGNVQTILHVDNNGNTTVVEQKDGESTENSAVSFAADSFSVYILVYSNTLEKTVLASDGETYRITLSYDADAGIPADAELAVEEILPDSEEYKTYLQMAENSVENEMVSFARFFDITILSGGQEIQPAAPVDVKIELADTLEEGAKAIHFGEEIEVIDASVTSLPEKTTDAETAENAGSEMAFSADGFSVYGVIVTTLEKTITASDGNTYNVSVTYGADAKIPVDAVLSVEEILSESEKYSDYVNETETVLGLEAGSLPYARFFDITILGAEEEKLQPAEGTTVAVSVQLLDREVADTAAQVVHFGEEETEILTNTVEGDTVAFEASSFSVYAIVDAPKKAEPFGWNNVTDLTMIKELGEDQGLVIGHTNGYYATNHLETNVGNNASRTGITKTEKSDTPLMVEGAAAYYFEEAVLSEDGKTLTTKIYCYDNDDNKQYVMQSGNSLSFVPGPNVATVFKIAKMNETDAKKGFRIEGQNGYCWNMQGGAGGKAFAAFNNLTDVNAQFNFWAFEGIEGEDPFGLNGQSFGLIYEDNTVFSKALMADSVENGLAAKGVPTLDLEERSKIRYITKDSDITEWTFEWVEKNRYRIMTTVDGEKKYLTIGTDGNVSLESTPGERALVEIPYEAQTDKGQYRFMVGTYNVNWNSNDENGYFTATKSLSNGVRFSLAEKTTLSNDDLLIYSANKVSVSDTEKMPDGAEVVIYTRVWNDEDKRYEFYVVDYDGTLKRAYDGGDTIQWAGNNLNTAKWDFTEYHHDETADPLVPNYYYELYNSYSREYLVPHQAEGTVLSDSKVGINLNGRKYGETYTSIIAWDQEAYAFSGLKVEDGKLVPCPLKEADDFYFAIINEQIKTEPTTTVETVDNDVYGITMKMIDYNNGIVNGRDSLQTAVLERDSNAYGLVSSQIGVGEYPVAVSTGRSLGELFGGAKPVNHLFIESIHNESGYFEYDSTSNFAHLNDDGKFTVYDQIGSISDYTGITGRHGQFLPYDNLGDEYCPQGNTTSVLAEPLPDDNPRKGEKLYSVGTRNTVDYFFGMEMEASFTQTPSGLDAWGHDIIFEFSGDDDFWLYVDGELILDVGGVHAASVGTINFRTGEVKTIIRDVQGKTVRFQNTTLRELFEEHYREENPDATDADVSGYLDGIFKDGGTVFTDYSKHDMRMFYMERGAGASNLHMRFNLAAVKPGTFTLSKKLSGTEKEKSDIIEFPYQIWYKTKDDLEQLPHLLGDEEEERSYVNYNETSNPVPYQRVFTPAGGTEAYEHVFFLKPGETAEVRLPEGALDYWVVECGVNPDVYDTVTVNEEKLEGTVTGNTVNGTARQNFATSEATLEERSSVTYDNHVKPGAVRSLTLTKRLYAEDGNTPLQYPEDKTMFSFRLSLGSENADPNNLPPADTYDYHVKDSDGFYCYWDMAAQEFSPTGITDYNALLQSQYSGAATFQTSMYGSISNIPADHTVEIRNLIAGTQFMVEERAGDIPKGYTLRLGDGYSRMDEGNKIEQGDPISGTIVANNDPALEVRNQKGWGLTVEKVWTDKDFMSLHDPIYFAVFFADEDGKPGTMVPDTLRQMKPTDKSIYYFFHSLESGKQFKDYVVYEVTVEGEITVNPDGTVTGYDDGSVLPVQSGGQITIGGVPIGETDRTEYTYTAEYTKGEMTDRNENVRTDIWTNSRPGIVLYKTDWAWNTLAGATFTLTNEDGNKVGSDSYTSDENGLITIAYLSKGTYYLNETVAPKRYVGIGESVIITMRDNDTVTVTGPDDYFAVSETAPKGMLAEIKIRNRGSVFEIKKVGTEGEGEEAVTTPLADVHFALYRQVKTIDGDVQKAPVSMQGYEDLATDVEGIIPKISMSLAAGTYYLEETETPQGYEGLLEDLCFTIGEDGTVKIENEDEAHQDWLKTSVDETGNVSYIIAIPNIKKDTTKWARFKKTDMSGNALGNAVFTFATAEENDAGEPVTYTLTSRAPNTILDGKDIGGIMATEAGRDIFELTVVEGEDTPYILTETDAPAGYNMLTGVVKVFVTEKGVTARLGDTTTQFKVTGEGTEEDPYVVTITNSSGYELPQTGGRGTTLLTAIGAILSGTAGAILTLKMRKEYA